MGRRGVQLNVPTAARLLRTLVWRRIDRPGAEYFELWGEDDGGWRLDGRLVLALDGRPFQVSYRVWCDADWATRAVNLLAREGDRELSLVLSVDAERRWWAGDRELRTLHGCADVDLGFTPATNTLPIRRSGLAVGGSTKVDVAWVSFPELEIRPDQQAYTRLTDSSYRYEEVDGSFEAEIETDELGLVTRYAGGWERVAGLG